MCSFKSRGRGRPPNVTTGVSWGQHDFLVEDSPIRVTWARRANSRQLMQELRASLSLSLTIKKSLGVFAFVFRSKSMLSESFRDFSRQCYCNTNMSLNERFKTQFE